MSRSLRCLQAHCQSGPGGVRNLPRRLSALPWRDHQYGCEVWKVLHRPCTLPTECTRWYIGISRRLFGHTSWSDRESTYRQPWPILSKIRSSRCQNPERGTSSRGDSRDFHKSRTQKLVIPIHRHCPVRHIARYPKEAVAIKRKAPWFYYNAITWTLHRRSYNRIILHCLSCEEAQEALKEAHDSTCGAHQLGPKLLDRLRRLDYYWPRMISDAIAYAKLCPAYQINDDFIHQAPRYLHLTSPS